VEFEWDPARSEATFWARGFDFAYASRALSGNQFETIDARFDYGEARVKAIGQVGPDVLVVICTVRGSLHRIISARRANRMERTQWFSRGSR
jgi:uncharacterized DUF497 family protein